MCLSLLSIPLQFLWPVGSGVTVVAILLWPSGGARKEQEVGEFWVQ